MLARGYLATVAASHADVGYPAGMNVFTKRNALVGFLTLQALERRRRRRRNSVRLGLYLALGVVSAGILAVALAIALRRRADDGTADASFDSESEIVGEYVTAPEPVTAT